MSKQKLYFKNEDAEMCYSLKQHLEEAKDDLEETVELIEAVADKDMRREFVWCMAQGAVGEKSECNKLSCEYYVRTTGRFCDNRGNVYTYGEKIMFDVKMGKRIF